jgi:hypothetical protein
MDLKSKHALRFSYAAVAYLATASDAAANNFVEKHKLDSAWIANKGVKPKAEGACECRCKNILGERYF